MRMFDKGDHQLPQRNARVQTIAYGSDFDLPRSLQMKGDIWWMVNPRYHIWSEVQPGEGIFARRLQLFDALKEFFSFG